MKIRILNIALAFAVVLSLSCCGAWDEILIDEIPTKTTSETAETTSVETSLTIPDEETKLASLTDEEKEVWLSMPDIVTMRALYRYDEDDQFLYTEIVYIDKIGRVNKFISYDDCKSPYDDVIIPWLNDQISHNENAEIADTADIHTLIEFYNTFMRIDNDSKLYLRYTITLGIEIKRHYGFELYGIRNNGKNDFETLLISSNNAGNPYIRRNHTEKNEPLDTSGDDTLELYLQLDPFMVLEAGGLGHLVGEEG